MMYPQVNAVIALLSVPEIQFDMEDPNHCIGGYCVKSLNVGRYLGIEEAFMRVSGIDDSIIAQMVCFPIAPGSYESTVAQAINMLEYLRDHGIVDWTRALGETHA